MGSAHAVSSLVKVPSEDSIESLIVDTHLLDEQQTMMMTSLHHNVDSLEMREQTIGADTGHVFPRRCPLWERAAKCSDPGLLQQHPVGLRTEAQLSG